MASLHRGEVAPAPGLVPPRTRRSGAGHVGVRRWGVAGPVTRTGGT